MRDLKRLEDSLGVCFRQKGLLEEALTHRSYLNESKTARSSNERLEFLGDAILAFFVSSHLFNTFPKLSEGKLTNLRSAMVRTSTLARVAKKLKLGRYLYLSHGEEESGGRNNPSLLADCFEAVVAALMLDQGLKATKNFINKHLISELSEIIAKGGLHDYKSTLQERVQERLRISPFYKVLKEEGPDHAKTFYVGVYVDNELLGKGQGKNKQEAEQHAAADALEKWGEKG